MDDANPDLVLRAVLFGAVGTAGQRCTTTRRLFLQRGIARARSPKRWSHAYQQVRIGDPLDERTLMGPLVNRRAVDDMMDGLDASASRAAKILYGGERLGGCFVEPTLVQRPARTCRSCKRRDLRAHPLPGGVRRARRGHPLAQRRAAGPLVGDVHHQPDFGRDASSAIAAATAASPTSTSAPAARKSAARSAARKTPAADANRAAIPGRPTCAARPIRSTGPANCRWRRASNSSSDTTGGGYARRLATCSSGR